MFLSGFGCAAQRSFLIFNNHVIQARIIFQKSFVRLNKH